MGFLLRDLRFGLRNFRQNPGFAAIAVVCLALGIGATTAIFSVVNAVVMRPLGYRQPQQLVRIYSEFPTFPNGGLRKFWLSAPELLDLQRDTRSWQNLEGWVVGGVNIGGTTEPVRATAAYVTGDMLPMLGVAPARGRLIGRNDDKPGVPLQVAISTELWKTAFGGRADILNRDIRVDGTPATIAGVMPAGFRFPPGEVDAPQIWIPLQIDPAKPGGRGSHYLYLLGRLKPGIAAAQAQGELERLVEAYGRLDTPHQHHFSPEKHTLVSAGLQEETVGSVRPAMLAMLAAVGFVLLIACVNVANLLLARAEARQKEIAVRTAMGAGLGRLGRQFFAEGALLSVAGAMLGLFLAWGGLRLILASAAQSIPRIEEIGLDWRVLLFTVAVSLATGIFFGLAPMAQLGGPDVYEVLKSAGGRTTATLRAQLLRHAMVVSELALALVLLIGTGLTVRAFWGLLQVNSGVRPEGVLTLRVELPSGVYPESAAVIRYWQNAERRLREIPGVTDAAMVTGLPPARRLNANDTMIEGFVARPGGPIENIDFYNVVGTDYFKSMGVPLIEGRLFDDRDGAGAPPAVIVNQTMARRFFPGESAIGHRLRPSRNLPWFPIVGVVADVKNAGIDQPAGTEIYFDYRQTGGRGIRNAYVVMHCTGDPRKLIPTVRREMASLDASLPIYDVRTMDEILYESRARPRFLTLLLTLFSVVAVTLAAMGIYGVMSYVVARRTGEIGLRMAIGAEPAQVLRMVLRQGLAIGAAGIGIGALGAAFLTRFLEGLFQGVVARDTATFAGMAVLLTAIVLAACLFPARRAMKIDPMVALRYE